MAGILLLFTGCNFESEKFWYDGIFGRTYEQVDRIGLPHLDEVFFGDSALLEIRSGDPSTDVEELQPVMAESLTVLRTKINAVIGFPDQEIGAISVEDLAEQWVPNVLTLSFSENASLESGQGRPLKGEDSFNVMVSLALGRSVDDRVDLEEEQGVSDTFPFLEPTVNIDTETEVDVADDEDLEESEEKIHEPSAHLGIR